MFSSRGRNERIEQARESAISAKDSAAGAFLALDDAHKMTQAMVEAYARIEPGAKADRVASELAPLMHASDTVQRDYIGVDDQHNGALFGAEPTLDVLKGAHAAFYEIYGRLEEARTGLDNFRARHSAELQDQLSAVQERVQPAIGTANQALARARAAAARAREAGIVSADVDTRLARAESLGEIVSKGAFGSGAQAVINAAQDLGVAADAVEEIAERLLALKQSGGSRLASSRTRLSGIEGRIPSARDTLSALRRTYSLACSEDLDHVPDLAAREVATAAALLDKVAAAQQAGDWDGAAEHLEDAREHLKTAESGIGAVIDRRRDLDELASDPEAERQRVRFVVRDAQRLVVSAGAKAPRNEASILDTAIERLDGVGDRLDGNHPDYWSYLVELRAVREVVDGVVRRTREALAKG